MADLAHEPSLYFPSLSGFYSRIEPYGYPLIRFASGLILFPHGWAKLMGAAPMIAQRLLGPMGFPVPIFWAYLLGFMETLGGVLLAFGLFTRAIAAMLVVEFAVVTFAVHFPHGYAFSSQGGGYEYPLLLLVIYIGIFMRGSDRCAIDRMIGKQF